MLLVSVVTFTIVSIYGISIIGEHGWALDQGTYPFLLASVCALSLAATSIWTAVVVIPEKRDASVSILPGMAAL